MQTVNAEQKSLLQVPESEVSNEVIMADFAKIKEVNTSSSSHVLPERLRLDQAIKAYTQRHSAEKKSGAKWSTYKKERQEVPYFQISC